MPISEILAGRNQLTERPIPERRYRFNRKEGDDTHAPVFVALTYDTRHLYTDSKGRTSPLLLLADDANEVIHVCSVDPEYDEANDWKSGIESLIQVPYPSIVDSSLVTTGEGTDSHCHQCMGLATIETADDSYIMFLSEPQVGYNYQKNTSGKYLNGRIDGVSARHVDKYPSRYPILYTLSITGSSNGVFDASNKDSFNYKVVEWAVVDAGNVSDVTALPTAANREGYTQCNIYADPSNTITAESYKNHRDNDEIGRGLTAYHGDLMTVGKWNGVDTLVTIDKKGQPLSYHPAFRNTDRLCGVQYLNGRTYVTMDRSSTDAHGRILAKFLTEQIDTARMIPLMSIEPFFFQPTTIAGINKRYDFEVTQDPDTGKTTYKRRVGTRDAMYAYGPDITLFQDRMAACFLDSLYTYRMAYFTFIVDGMPNDDIDIGSVLIGDYKIKKVTFKNIADVYSIRKVELTVDKDSIGTGTAQLKKLHEATHWVFFTATDPTNDTTDIVQMSEQNASGQGLPSGTIWAQTIEMATQPPYIAPDGEINFYVAVGIPSTYTDNVAVTTDDGPYIVPVITKCILG